jgi:hypothetical protein
VVAGTSQQNNLNRLRLIIILLLLTDTSLTEPKSVTTSPYLQRSETVCFFRQQKKMPHCIYVQKFFITPCIMSAHMDEPTIGR